MSLSKLVKFRNELSELVDQLSIDHCVNEKTNLFYSLQLRNEVENYNHLIQQHIDNYQSLIEKNNDIVILVKNLIVQIEHDITQLAGTIDDGSATEENTNFLLASTDEIKRIIQSRISILGDWHYPGLQICRYADNHWQAQDNLDEFVSAKTLIDLMVGCDPLYITGNNIKVLENIISPFPDVYQRRLRLYEFKNRNFNMLPQAQFGTVLCWDYFNYLPLATIEIYLKEIIKLLRPGGKLLFSYNNGDLEASARLVEEQKACWATSKLLKDMISNIGYEFVVAENFPTHDMFNNWVSWMEVKKPGELTTVKRAQALGAVLAK